MSTSSSSTGGISVRFGDPILQAGFTAIPNLILNHYAALEISPAEMLFTIHVWQHWWSEKLPFPSLQLIAQKMGVERRQARRYVQGLKEKGYLAVSERNLPGFGQVASEYDFSPMIEAVLHLAVSEQLQEQGTPRSNLSQGGRSNLTDGGRAFLTEAPRSEMPPEKDPRKKTKNGSAVRTGNAGVDAELQHQLEQAQEILWPAVLGNLKSQMTQANFDTWLRETQLVSLTNSRAVISAPSPYIVDWLNTRFRLLVQKELHSVLDRRVSCDFILARQVE
jgi:hypothetical protein